jgi:hypothetical protein
MGLRPVKANSAKASPIAAECLNPCPEQQDAMMTRSTCGWRSMTNPKSDVTV